MPHQSVISVQHADWPAANFRLTSFDGGFAAVTRCYQPDRYSFWDGQHNCTGISRGAGLSYAAASFALDGITIDHRRFNRILDFDSATNVVEVEAGATLATVYNFSTPRGLFLSVQPGHPSISVGGCIGTDVHGKNQYRDGTIMSQVVSLQLFHADHGILQLSRDENADLFRLTCGGYGLTGNIITARLKLRPLPSMQVRLSISPIERYADLPDALIDIASNADLVYSWHDFGSDGSRFGAGLLISGTFAPADDAHSARSHAARLVPSSLTAESRGFYRLPMLNGATVPFVNHAYRRLAMSSAGVLIPLHKFLFPVLGKEAYFQLFGTRGFHEYQVILPSAAFRSFVDEVKKRLLNTPVAITLASGKLFSGNRELLRFTGAGVCFALNFPRTPAGLQFAAFLDDLILDLGGWPNISKDSRLSAAVTQRAYPEYDRFKTLLQSFDPRRLYKSELSQRLAL
jgi:decaprenylphospho-beta-D-ribofuranose 2-oxidase